MNIKQFRSLFAVGVLWLALGVGCKKDPPEPEPISCRDGTCCGPFGIHYLYAESYENVPVTLGGSYDNWGLEFSNPIPIGTKETWKTSARVCDLTIDKAIQIKQKSPNDTLIKCRVWGRLYIADEVQQIAYVGLPRYFAIDRIEVIK